MTEIKDWIYHVKNTCGLYFPSPGTIPEIFLKESIVILNYFTSSSGNFQQDQIVLMFYVNEYRYVFVINYSEQIEFCFYGAGYFIKEEILDMNELSIKIDNLDSDYSVQTFGTPGIMIAESLSPALEKTPYELAKSIELIIINDYFRRNGGGSDSDLISPVPSSPEVVLTE